MCVCVCVCVCVCTCADHLATLKEHVEIIEMVPTGSTADKASQFLSPIPLLCHFFKYTSQNIEIDRYIISNQSIDSYLIIMSFCPTLILKFFDNLSSGSFFRLRAIRIDRQRDIRHLQRYFPLASKRWIGCTFNSLGNARKL